MPPPSVLIQGITGRKKPSPNADGNRDGVPARMGRYGEEFNLSLIPKNHLLADEGSFFVATNPTPGTGIAAAASNSGVPTVGGNADTKPVIVAYNSAQPSDGTRAYLDALQLVVTAAGNASATAIYFAVQLDQAGPRIAGGAAVGGTLLSPINPNMDDGSTSALKVWLGANTVTGSSGAAGAGGSCRLLPTRQLRPVIPVVGDVYAITFGGSEQFVGSLAPAGTAIAQQSFNYPPVIIGPQQVALIFLWLPSQGATGTSYLGDLAWWER